MAVQQKTRGAKRKPAPTAGPRHSAAFEVEAMGSAGDTLRSAPEDEVIDAKLPEQDAEFDERTVGLVKSLLLKARIAELDDPERHLAYVRSRIRHI